MRFAIFVFLAFLPCALALPQGAPPAAGEAVPLRWGGARSPNMVSEARDLPADLEGAKPLWELRLGMHQYTIPTVDRGRIYVGLDDANIMRPGIKPTGGGLLLCLEQATGKLIWQFHSPRYFEGLTEPYHFDQWKIGFASGPVVDGERVYIVGSRGEILCLDREGQANGNDGPFTDELTYMGLKEPGAALLPSDGDIIWCFRLIPEVDVVPHDVCASTLLLHGDLLYACTSNGVDGPHKVMARPHAPSLIALDRKTGRLVAREREDIGARTFHGTWSSPSMGQVGGRTLIFFGGGDGILYAFESPEARDEGSEARTLKKAWSHDCNPPDYRTRDGKPIPYARWNKNSPDGPSEILATPVFHEGRVYVTIGQSPQHGPGQGLLSCVDAATGNEIWASRDVDRSLATVSISGGFLYVDDYSGRLHCFDVATGRRCWVHELQGRAWSASTLVADGKVYAGTEDGVLWVLKAGKEKQVLARADMDSAVATPVAVDGILYVPTQRRLLAYQGRPATARGERSDGSKQVEPAAGSSPAAR
jgi:outer membrane protein assembly factor BamB